MMSAGPLQSLVTLSYYYNCIQSHKGQLACDQWELAGRPEGYWTSFSSSQHDSGNILAKIIKET